MILLKCFGIDLIHKMYRLCDKKPHRVNATFSVRRLAETLAGPRGGGGQISGSAAAEIFFNLLKCSDNSNSSASDFFFFFFFFFLERGGESQFIFQKDW